MLRGSVVQHKLFSIKWTLVYVALIPFVNWSFTWAPNIQLFGAWAFNPVTIVTGLVLVVRDFAQREVGHKVLLAMLIALALTVVLAGPRLALASGAAFAISELVDWSLFTFTRLRLSTRVFLSSLIAAPIDSVVFLLGAGFFTTANAIMSVLGKMVGAVVVALVVRRGEQRQKLQT
ncbi:Putative preQ0 transporter YhhQ [hydrothermal vent metagenome]|uniref:PreQ0 transporter YhhQ n=1 Tax=hydrothermal vent metagenome TaxID=652676 RepID=A0A3B0REN2_9ZZZZ